MIEGRHCKNFAAKIRAIPPCINEFQTMIPSIYINTVFLALISSTLSGAAADEIPQSWTPKQATIEAFQKRRPDFNVDESKVPSCKLPNPLISSSGKAVTTVQEWRDDQRPTLLNSFREHVYGVRPETPKTV
jgi:hypothetical protein